MLKAAYVLIPRRSCQSGTIIIEVCFCFSNGAWRTSLLQLQFMHLINMVYIWNKHAWSRSVWWANHDYCHIIRCMFNATGKWTILIDFSFACHAHTSQSLSPWLSTRWRRGYLEVDVQNTKTSSSRRSSFSSASTGWIFSSNEFMKNPLHFGKKIRKKSLLSLITETDENIHENVPGLGYINPSYLWKISKTNTIWKISKNSS